MNTQGFYFNSILRNENNSDKDQFNKDFEALLQSEENNEMLLENTYSENALEKIKDRFKGKTGQIGQGAGMSSIITMETAQKIIEAVAKKKKNRQRLSNGTYYRIGSIGRC